MTGGDPKATGIYYDVEYSHGVFPAGTTTCSGAVSGGDVIYDSPDDKLPAVADLLHNKSGNTSPSFDEGGSIYPGGVDTNPAKIMNLSPHPQSGLNPATYPVDPKTCQPIQPWDFLGVNTIFQVIHSAGLRTAWSDKHAIYTSDRAAGRLRPAPQPGTRSCALLPFTETFPAKGRCRSCRIPRLT